jgi:hypothetical protein
MTETRSSDQLSWSGCNSQNVGFIIFQIFFLLYHQNHQTFLLCSSLSVWRFGSVEVANNPEYPAPLDTSIYWGGFFQKEFTAAAGQTVLDHIEKFRSEISPMIVDISKHMDRQNDFFDKFKNSSHKGSLGENNLEQIISTLYQSAEIVNTSKDTAAVAPRPNRALYILVS